ncbi:MAG: hypothetical protein KC620_11165, partial [Myxococcales bacterium]|nr:hypothetical protein [Myxococcales bacterium]
MNRPAARLMGAVALALLPVAALAQGPRPLLTESDLAPVSLGRDDALARELIARHRWREAAAHISAHTPGARLVKGFLLERAGDGSGAVAALDGLAERLPVLGDFARVTLGEALLAAERMADAVKAVA